MAFYWLTLGVLATWRVAHLFNAEDGPWDIFLRARSALANGVFGDFLDCFSCLSLLAALPIAILVAVDWEEGVLVCLALSAGAILLERATSEAKKAAPRVQYFEGEAIDESPRGEPSIDDGDDRS